MLKKLLLLSLLPFLVYCQLTLVKEGEKESFLQHGLSLGKKIEID